MGVVFYNIFLKFFQWGTWLLSPFNPKASKWIRGRKDIFERLKAAIAPGTPLIWMHCASLGEFEQGRPLLERLRQEFIDHKFLLTFFSPSGYEVRKDYEGADWVFYLPMDGPANARRFLEITQPKLVIFVKYEFWYYYLKKIKYRNIPLLLVSALFRRDMSFFQWYGAIQRKILSRFDHLFVQNEASFRLMEEIGLSQICSVSGDTRFDRVIQIAESFQPLSLVQEFMGNNKLIVAGSTWKEDEDLIAGYRSTQQQVYNKVKWIIAPHEINDVRLSELQKSFPESILYSELVANKDGSDKQVLIIDNIGMLSRLYNYANLCIVGGGFGKQGIHNILEAAVFGKPVLFGPVFHQFYEAVQLVEKKGAISINNQEEFNNWVNEVLSEKSQSASMMGAINKEYVYANRGATDKIIGYIQEKRLLTR